MATKNNKPSKIAILDNFYMEFDGYSIGNAIFDLNKANEKVKELGGVNPYLESYDTFYNSGAFIVKFTRTETPDEIADRKAKENAARHRKQLRTEKFHKQEVATLKRLVQKHPEAAKEIIGG